MSKKDLLIPGSGGAMANVPAYAQAQEGDNNLLGDLGGQSFTRLTFKGSRFRIVKGEEETVLKGTELNTILLNAYPKVSRVYFAHAYGGDESTDSRPKCASADGEVPLPTVANPPSDKCATCPMNQKGSAISDDGGKRRACSFYKRIVLFLVDYPDLGPVVADAKAMTLFGDSYADRGLLNLRAYADKLAQHQTKPEAVITELSFDTNSSVPKVLFRAVSYVDEETYRDVVEPLIDSGILESLADTTQMRTEGADDDSGEKPSDKGFRDKLLEGKKPAHAAASTGAEEADDDEDEEEDDDLDLDSDGVAWDPNIHATSSKTGKGIKNKDGTWRARKGGPVEPPAKKAKPEPAAPAKPDHPKFCGDCGAKYGTCEHTGADDEEEEEEEYDESGDDDATAFDKDLEDALAEFDDD